MLVIAITGGMGSGKSQVAQLFGQNSIPHISADNIARDISAPDGEAYQSICSHFGQSIVQDNGQLNRTALRQLIFSHPEKREWLEQLMHPIIRRRMQEEIAQLSAPYCLVEIPLLAETTRADWIDRVLVVDAPDPLRIERIKKRDSLGEEEIEAILATQASRQQRLDMADDIIENNGSLSDLAAKVDELYSYYLLLTK